VDFRFPISDFRFQSAIGNWQSAIGNILIFVKIPHDVTGSRLPLPSGEGWGEGLSSRENASAGFDRLTPLALADCRLPIEIENRGSTGSPRPEPLDRLAATSEVEWLVERAEIGNRKSTSLRRARPRRHTGTFSFSRRPDGGRPFDAAHGRREPVERRRDQRRADPSRARPFADARKAECPLTPRCGARRCRGPGGRGRAGPAGRRTWRSPRRRRT